MRPVLNGLALAILGFALGIGTTGAVRIGLLGRESWWSTDLSWSIGYPLALIGWVAGVGGWRYWARGWFGLAEAAYTTSGWRRYFDFNVDHKVIGIQYIVTFVVIFLLSGLTVLIVRLELMRPGMQIFEVSAKTGEGMRECLRFFESRLAEIRRDFAGEGAGRRGA